MDPVVGAGDAVLDLQDRIERQRHQRDRERQHEIVRHVWLEQLNQQHAGDCYQRGAADRDPAAAREIAAKKVIGLASGVFGNEALCGRGKAQVGEVADHQHQGPDIDVDAELEGAHPAGEQDLRQVDQARAEHADEERAAGDLLRERAVAAVGEPGLDLRADLRGQTGHRHARRTIRILRLGQRHLNTPEQPRPDAALRRLKP